MKKIFVGLLCGLCCFLPSCVDVEPLLTARPEPCEQPDERLNTVRGFGRVRNLTIWVPERPATAEEISEGLVAMEPLTLWLIVTADDSLYEACNLPEGFKVDHLEIFFDAYALSEVYNNPRIEGIVPISLTEIEEEGDDDDF